MSKRNMVRTLLFSLLAFAFLLSASAVAQETRRNSVAQSRGASVSGINIIVKQKLSGNLIMTRTDANGEFYFKIVEPGLYVLQLFREGDLPEGVAQIRNYNSSKSITANRESGSGYAARAQVWGDPHVIMSEGLTWYSFEGWPYRFYVLGPGVELGRPLIREQGFAINNMDAQETSMEPFVEMGFAIKDQSAQKALNTVIRGRVLIEQGRGKQ